MPNSSRRNCPLKSNSSPLKIRISSTKSNLFKLIATGNFWLNPTKRPNSLKSWNHRLPVLWTNWSPPPKSSVEMKKVSNFSKKWSTTERMTSQSFPIRLVHIRAKRKLFNLLLRLKPRLNKPLQSKRSKSLFKRINFYKKSPSLNLSWRLKLTPPTLSKLPWLKSRRNQPICRKLSMQRRPKKLPRKPRPTLFLLQLSIAWNNTKSRKRLRIKSFKPLSKLIRPTN